MDYQRRFGGIARLYGQQALAAFAGARVCVIGVGGVGSWAVEALARSAIGQIDLIDLDHVAESNINRQLPALESNLGKAKVRALAERVAEINPECAVTCIEEFVTLDNLTELIDGRFDWVIDCIDNFRVKAALIAHGRRNKIKLITVGGAGGQIDPSRIRVSDLSRTEQDPLLAKCRRQLRKAYGFPDNPRRRFDIPAVWSDEPLRMPTACELRGDGDQPNSSLNCGGFGSAMPVTATFGLLAVAHVLRKLAEKGAVG